MKEVYQVKVYNISDIAVYRDPLKIIKIEKDNYSHQKK